MMEGTFCIADRVIKIISRYPGVQELCRDYGCIDAPELIVQISQDDIYHERQRSANGDRTTDAYLEELAVYRRIAEWMPSKDTLLFHGSAIAVDGCAYLFTAASGTGKSTHAGLWRTMLGDRAVMVNDDKPLIRVPEGCSPPDIPAECPDRKPVPGVTDTPVIYGTPWNGKHHLGANIAVPLKAVCILERAEENRIHEISGREALPMLLQQAYRPADPAAMKKTLTLIDRLLTRVRFYRLGCNMEPEAAEISYRAMHERKEQE